MDGEEIRKKDIRKDAGEEAGSTLTEEKSPRGSEEAAAGTDTSGSFVRRVQDRTRVFDVMDKDTRIVPSQRTHKWIDENDEPVIRPVRTDTMVGIDPDAILPPMDGRRTRAGRDSDLRMDDRRTRVGRDSDLRMDGRRIRTGSGAAADTDLRTDDRRTRVGRSTNTRVVKRVVTREPEAATGNAAGDESSFTDKVRLMTAGTGQVFSELRSVRVTDRRRFARFLKVIGAILVILILELGYFGFASHVRGMPAEIKKTKKELELTQKENVLLEEEIEALGDQNSVEELKASWEKLRDRLKKAEAETYY